MNRLHALMLLLFPLALCGQSKTDTASLQYIFRKGEIHGNFRTFFMATDNARQLTDAWAWAAGGNLRYQTAAFHGFRFGIGSSFVCNVASSDLTKKDPATNASNRYEVGLFDQEEPSNRADIGRINELWLQYAFKKHRLTLGQQSLQTPFINLQDGRMRPNAVSGLWSEWHLPRHLRLNAGWLWRMSPRGTARWFNVGESIGLYPSGFNPDGAASQYAGQLHSRGIALAGITLPLKDRIKIQVWQQFVDNIFYTYFAQADVALPLKNGHTLFSGLQWVHQNALHDGGNNDPTKTYFPKKGHSQVFSAQFGWRNPQAQAILAYTRVTAEGRFLFPREWGREPFYTFLPRERIEGAGDVHDVCLRFRWHNHPNNLEVEAGIAHVFLPDVQLAALNKYAFPSYRQVNLQFTYAFGRWLEGLRLQALYVWKGRAAQATLPEKYVINKVDLSNYNLIVQYLL